MPEPAALLLTVAGADLPVAGAAAVGAAAAEGTAAGAEETVALEAEELAAAVTLFAGAEEAVACSAGAVAVFGCTGFVCANAVVPAVKATATAAARKVFLPIIIIIQLGNYCDPACIA